MEIKEPRIPIYSNVTGKPFGSAADIGALLPRQLVEAVQWEGTLRALVASGELAGRAQHSAGARRVQQRRLCEACAGRLGWGWGTGALLACSLAAYPPTPSTPP